MGDTDLKLNEAGRHEATERAAVATSMKPAMLYCGEDSTGALETAGIVGKALNLKVRKQKAFREMDLGHWEGLTTEQFRERFPTIYKQWRNDPLAVEPPKGESITTVVERITDRLARLMKKSDDSGGRLGAWRICPCGAALRVRREWIRRFLGICEGRRFGGRADRYDGDHSTCGRGCGGGCLIGFVRQCRSSQSFFGNRRQFRIGWAASSPVKLNRLIAGSTARTTRLFVVSS